MESSDPKPDLNSSKPVYTWPKYVLAMVILGIVLAVVAIYKEARRVQSMEHLPMPSPKTGAAASNSAANPP